MAQTNFTPILLYSSGTSGNTPGAASLTNSTNGSEIAINIADGRLFYKDTGGVVQKIADKLWVGTVTSVSGTGSVNGITLTGTVTSSGSITLGGTLSGIGNSQLTNSTISGVALGGNLFNLTAGTGVSFSSGTTYNGSTAITINATGTGGTVTSVAALTIGTTGTDLSSTVANGTTTPVITLNVPTASATNRGALSAADWTTFNNKTSNTGTVTSVAATVPTFLSISGSPITTSGTLAITLSGTALPTTSGGTGLTSFTANGIVYASSTSALTTGSSLTWSGTVLNAGGSGASTIIANGNTAGNGGAAFKMLGWANTAKNWEISAGFVGGFGLDFRPSSTAGGTTFTTSVLNIGENGSITSSSTGTFAGNVTASVAATATAFVASNGTDSSYFGFAQANGNYNSNALANDCIVRGKNGVSIAGNSGAAAIRVDNGGTLTFYVADQGIIFNKTGALNNSNLNDYETGTWTPTFNAAITGTSSASGKYTKIGRLVKCTCTVVYTGLTGSTVIVSALPFTNGSIRQATVVTFWGGADADTANAAGIVVEASDTIFYAYPPSGASYSGASRTAHFSCWYQV